MKTNDAINIQPTVHREASSRLYGLDALRALAILGVLMYHYHALDWEHPKWMENIFFKFGWSGVDLFFVLSGFLISSQLIRELETNGNLSFKSFYLKRSFRILPNYWFVLAVYFFLPSVREVPDNTPWLKLLTFTQNLGYRDSTFSHAWSLCIEEHFYLFLPLGLLFLTKKKWMHRAPLLIGVTLLAGFVWKMIVMVWMAKEPSPQLRLQIYHMWLYRPTFARLDGLLVGVLIAWVWNYAPALRAWLTRHQVWCLGAGIFLMVVSSWAEAHHNFIPYRIIAVFGGRYTVVSIAFGLVLIAAISPGSLLDRLRWKPVSMMATYSYAIYLSHKIAITLTHAQMEKIGFELNGEWTALVSFAMCFVVGMAMHYAIERPSHAVRQKMLTKIQ